MKERFQNPVTGDTVRLRLYSYNSQNKADFYSVEKVEIYFLDPSSVTDTNKDGRVLLDSFGAVAHTAPGEYFLDLPLVPDKYVIGTYIDVWHVQCKEGQANQSVSNSFRILPDQWYTTPLPIVYDFGFQVKPNKIRKGSKRFLIIDIEPNVPKASDLDKYYLNLAIASPLKISIQKAACGSCESSDLRMVVEAELIEQRDMATAYYQIDTSEMEEGIYDVWFEMEFADNVYISDKQQIQIY